MVKQFKITDFSKEEFKQIIERSKGLIKRGYFSGINFLQSEAPLPQDSIIMHFLHDSKRQIESIEPQISSEHLIVPRFTYYMLRPEYFRKPNFKEEYKNAIFFGSDFQEITIEEAIRNPEMVTVSNKELDLIIPILNFEPLAELLARIREADRKGPEPWIDPVIIIKTERPLKTIEQFVDKYFVSIALKREEFYSVLTDKIRMEALEKYLDRLCQKIKVGKLKRSDVVFYPSQVNTEFAKYLSSIQNQLLIE